MREKSDRESQASEQDAHYDLIITYRRMYCHFQMIIYTRKKLQR